MHVSHSFYLFWFLLEVGAITQDLIQTSVNLRGDEVVYSISG